MDQGYVKTHHVIERYLAGQLTVEQTEEFEVCCLENPEVAKNFEYARALKHELSETVLHTKKANTRDSWLRKFFRPGIAVPAAGILAFFTANLLVGPKTPTKVVLGEYRDGALAAQPVPRTRAVEFELDLPSQTPSNYYDIAVYDVSGMEIQRWKKHADGTVAAVQMDTRELEHGEYEFIVYGEKDTPLRRYKIKLNRSE